MTGRSTDEGMILLNVLAAVAIAATVVTVMLASEPPTLDRATRSADASRAMAIARGGEASAVAALRRSATSRSDCRADDWGRIAQPETAIAGGRFALSVADAQARVNVNSAAPSLLAGIAVARSLPADTVDAIVAFITAHGPVADVRDLAQAGLPAATIGTLQPYLVALPGATPVNLNTAPESLLAILLHDPGEARILVARRARAGCLTADDLALDGISVPAGAGFTSDHFFVTTTVVQGGTRLRLTSLLERRRAGDRSDVAVIARSRGRAPDR